MEQETALDVANEALFQSAGRRLNPVETAILRGAWERHTYGQIADEFGYSANYLKLDVGPKLWKLLSEALGEKVTKPTFAAAVERYWQRDERNRHQYQFANPPPDPIGYNSEAESFSESSPFIDWGEAIDVSRFYGRTEELATLHQWCVADRCRLVALLGMGGIGKSALSVKLTEEIQGEFDAVIWRSLRNAPPLDSLLSELVSFLSHQQTTEPTIPNLLQCLRASRCLVVLDNLETILQSGRQAGYFRTGYEKYGQLLRVVGEVSHPSCLLLTSREKPAEVSTFEGIEAAVRSLSLSGALSIVLPLIESQGLSGTDEQKRSLCQHYGNSPLALKIVASSIQDLFDGDIAQFLKEDATIFYGVQRLLDQQFSRLSELERSVMYWLAINREWTSIADLATDIVPHVSRTKLLAALESLSWRSLIEKQASRYTQQPVVMEYVTDRLTEQAYQDIAQANLPLRLLHHHALLKTTVKDYVRESQRRLILQPIASRLRTDFVAVTSLATHFQKLFEGLRQTATPGYSGGNVINLAYQLNLDLTGYDFSGLTIWHAYLQNVELQRVSFQNADLTKSVFTQLFLTVGSVVFSPDGRYLASSHTDGKIRIWRVAERHPLLMFQGHDSWVWSVAWSPDGQMLATAGTDHLIKLWQPQTGECLKVLAGHDNWVWSVAWSPDGNYLASGSVDQTLRLWRVETGACIQVYGGHQGEVRSVAFSPNGQYLASASQDRMINIWDVLNGQCIKTLIGHTDGVWSVVWVSDTQLASGSSDRTVRLWDIVHGICLRTYQGHRNEVSNVAFSPYTRQLASGSIDHTIRLWDIERDDCVQLLQGHQHRLWDIDFSPDGKTLVSGSVDRTIRLWDTQTGHCVKTLRGANEGVFGMALQPHSDPPILACSYCDQTIRIWNVSTSECLSVLKGHTSRIWQVAWRSDGQVLASSSDDHTVRLWNPHTGKCLSTLRGHTHQICSVAWNADNQTLASGSLDSTIKLWDTTTQTCSQTLTGHESWVWMVAWHPEGELLTSGSRDQTIKLWSACDGNCIQTLAGHSGQICAVDWNPQGTLLASSSSDQTIKLWDWQQALCLQTLSGHTNWVMAIRWQPQGHLLASISMDQTVRVWDVATGHCVMQFTGLVPEIWGLEWISDHILASGGGDGVVRFWDTQTGDCRQTIQPERPYEGMNITGATGITEAQKSTLRTLGAVEC
jgi:WD40 repeat protein